MLAKKIECTVNLVESYIDINFFRGGAEYDAKDDFDRLIEDLVYKTSGCIILPHPKWSAFNIKLYLDGRNHILNISQANNESIEQHRSVQTAMQTIIDDFFLSLDNIISNN